MFTQETIELCSNIDSNIFTLFSQVRKLRLRHISILLVRVSRETEQEGERRERGDLLSVIKK